MKTTLLGILTILATVTGTAVRIMNGDPVDFPAVAAAVAAGVGLIKAADQKPKP